MNSINHKIKRRVVSGTFTLWLDGEDRNVLFASWRRMEGGEFTYDITFEESSVRSLAEERELHDNEFRPLHELTGHDQEADHYEVDKLGGVIRITGDTGSEENKLRIGAVVHQ